MPTQPTSTLSRLQRFVLAMAAPLAVVWPALSSGPAAAIEFSDVDIFFELNATDRDLDVQVALDADAWKALRIRRPDGNQLIEVEPSGNLARLGLTELSLTSDERSPPEVPFTLFLARIPAGIYTFLGTTTDNQPLHSTDRLTTDIPCPVTVLSPPVDDEVDVDNVVISWRSAPGVYEPDTRRCSAARRVGLVGYRVVVNVANEARGIDRDLVVDLPPDARRFSVPQGFLLQAARLPGSEFEFSVFAIEDSGNRTHTEQAFEVATAVD